MAVVKKFTDCTNPDEYIELSKTGAGGDAYSDAVVSIEVELGQDTSEIWLDEETARELGESILSMLPKKAVYRELPTVMTINNGI